MQSTLSLAEIDDIVDSELDGLDELYHHGIKGQKWGNRRWQFLDGSLTEDGRVHYGIGEARDKLKAASNALSERSNKFIKQYQDMKIDTLDVLNRKGVLDFLDSKADAPFEAIRSGVGSGRFKDTESGKSVFRAMNNLERYREIADVAKDIKFDKKFKEIEQEHIDSDTKHAILAMTRTDSSAEQKSREQQSELSKYGETAKLRAQRGDATKSYSKMLDFYEENDMSGIVKGLLKAEGQSVYDKMLGMHSKTARDVEREANAKQFIDYVKTDGEVDVSKASQRWYKTKDDGSFLSYEQATGKSGDIREEREIAVPKYKTDVVQPERTITNTSEWKKFEGDTREGHYDNSGNLWKYDDNGIARETHTTYVPAKTSGYFDTNDLETKKVSMVVGKTKEYLDYMDRSTLSSDYNELISDYKPIVDTGSEWLKTLQHLDSYSDELYHHGIKGQRWGNRRYQYENGSLTDEGRAHYGVGPAREKIGKAVGSVKEAIRKKVRPTNDELDEKIARQNAKNADKLARLQKKEELRAARNAVRDKKINDKLAEAQAKEERQRKQEYIDHINGKKKKLSQMSDRELQDEFMRLQRQKQIRDMDQDLNQGAVSKFMKEYVRSGLGEGLRRGIAGGIEKRVSRNVGGDAKEYALRKAENELKLDILKGTEGRSEKAQQRLFNLDNRGKKKEENYQEKFRNKEAELKYNVLSGDEETSTAAANRLKDLRQATNKDNGKGKNNGGGAIENLKEAAADKIKDTAKSKAEDLKNTATDKLKETAKSKADDVKKAATDKIKETIKPTSEFKSDEKSSSKEETKQPTKALEAPKQTDKAESKSEPKVQDYLETTRIKQSPEHKTIPANNSTSSSLDSLSDIIQNNTESFKNVSKNSAKVDSEVSKFFDDYAAYKTYALDRNKRGD